MRYREATLDRRNVQGTCTVAYWLECISVNKCWCSKASWSEHVKPSSMWYPMTYDVWQTGCDVHLVMSVRFHVIPYLKPIILKKEYPTVIHTVTSAGILTLTWKNKVFLNCHPPQRVCSIHYSGVGHTHLYSCLVTNVQQFKIVWRDLFTIDMWDWALWNITSWFLLWWPRLWFVTFCNICSRLLQLDNYTLSVSRGCNL